MTAKTKAKPKPTGRHPMAAEDRRTTLIRVLTTDEEKEELQHAAEAASMSLSTWVRSAALSAARKIPSDGT